MSADTARAVHPTMSYAVLVAASKRLLGPEAVEERPPHVRASRPPVAGTAPA